MAAEWHYSKDGKKTGPISAQQLKSLADSGELLPHDLICKDGMAEWKPAKNVKGLFVAVSVVESPNASTASKVETAQAELPISKGNSFVENAKIAAKGAAQYAAKQTERTKLTTLTLPPLYQALGRYAYSTPDYRAEFAELFQQLDQVQKDQSDIKGRTPVETKSFGDKAKAMAGKAMEAAQSQKLSLRQTSLFGSLGKSLYEKHKEQSGQQELIKPIAESLARLATLDSELNALSAPKDGSWLTPKRIVIAIAATSIVVLLSFFMMGRGESNSYTQRVLDLTSSEMKEFGVSIPKGAKPLFTPGSTEDFIQSLTLFKVAGNVASFNNHTILGNGARAWGDTDSLNGIAPKCKIQFGGGIFMKTKCWDMIYGPIHGLETVKEKVTYGGNMSPGQMIVDRWVIACKDESLIVRGANRNVPGVQMKKDEIVVSFVHFNEPYKSIFPSTNKAGGKVKFDY